MIITGNLDRFSLSLLMTGLLLMSPLAGGNASASMPALPPDATGSLPTAGTVLGWELNMGQIYSQKLRQDLIQPTNPSEDPIIFYENRPNPRPDDRPFLLNTPRPR